MLHELHVIVERFREQKTLIMLDNQKLEEEDRKADDICNYFDNALEALTYSLSEQMGKQVETKTRLAQLEADLMIKNQAVLGR